MPEEMEQRRRKADTEENGWLSKAKVLGDFVNKVGMPAMFFIVVMTLGVGLVIGKIKSPFVTSAEFEQHQAAFADHRTANEAAHKQNMEGQQENVKAFQAVTKALQVIACDHKTSDAARVACFRSN